jgi:hypothetical protein
VIDGAEGYKDIRRRALKVFRDEKKPDELAGIIEHAVQLCELNGQLSVREDDPSEDRELADLLLQDREDRAAREYADSSWCEAGACHRMRYTSGLRAERLQAAER